MGNSRARTNKKRTLREIITSKMSKEDRDVLIKREAEEYLAICRDESCHKVVKQVKKSKHFLKWAIKLILPDFLVGHPNLFDNFRTLRTHPQFHAFRRAIIAWIIFTVIVSSSGIYSLINAKKSSAQVQFQFKTGYYLGAGDGTVKHITGLGFKPEVLIIKADTTAGYAIFKTASMSSGEYAYFAASADNVENQITFDDDGFTLQLNGDVNANNVIYKYIAFAGNDCSSSGVMCYGSYNGNYVVGSPNQTINTGFSPDLVIVKRTITTAANFLTSVMPDSGAGYASFFTATADDTTANYFPANSISSNGFTVGPSNNTYAGLFYYLTFKKGAGILDVGSYTGNGTSQTISPPLMSQVTPNFVLTKATTAVLPVFNTTQSYGDYSSVLSNAANVTGAIKQLIPGGFSLGNSSYSNSNNTGYWYFSFAGGNMPVANGSFLMKAGSYVGDGSANRTIGDIGFTPDLVIVKSDGPDYAIWSTSMDYNFSHYFSVALAGITNAILGMVNGGFTIGSHSTVNTNGTTYHYEAFGNASTPFAGGRAADFVIGAYTGNGLVRDITNLPVSPDMVMIKENGTDAATVWSSTIMATGTTAFLSATTNDVSGNLIKQINSDGFSLGTNNIVNRSGYVNNFFAFSKSAAFNIGLYTGSGSQQDITTTDGNTAIGFTPDYVITKRSTNVDPAHRSSAIDLGNTTQYFKNVANFNNGITDIINGGFRVSTDATVNTNSGTYYFFAWKDSTATTSPATPVNVSPPDNASDIGLNDTLQASAYTDLNPQLGTMWQIADDPNFNSLVWSRTTNNAETSIVINSSNGVFSGSLNGKQKLKHNTNYYWRVKYSNSVYSAWSTSTSFKTLAIDKPTNISPTDQEIISTLSPLLSASTFSDPEVGDTANLVEWQIDTKINFDSPIYDSGSISYNNSITIPDATLSDRTVYYWRVRYLDSDNQWSDYSTPTRFLTSKEAEVSVNPLFGGNVVNQGDQVKIDAQVKTVDGLAVNDATTTISIYNPSGAKIINNETMNYIASSSGIYRYPFTIPNIDGSYLYEISAKTGIYNGLGAANFEVRNTAQDIADTKSTVVNNNNLITDTKNIASNTQNLTNNIKTTVEDTQNIASNTQNLANNIKTTVDDTQSIASSTNSLTSSIKNTVESNKANLDILVGAFIVTQGSVNDASPTTNSFISSLTNSTDNFYKNSVLTFTSGVLDGQSRRVSDYSGTTKRFTLDPALTNAPVTGDTFTITTQNVRVEEQVADHEASSSAFRADTTSRLTSIEGKVDSIISTLNTVDSNLDDAQSMLNQVRQAQNNNYTIEYSDISKIQAGTTYRAKLTILDFQDKPVDASSTPSVIIYDPTRATATGTPATMTRLSTGVYEYTYITSTDAVAGLWESVATININGENITKNDYFEVAGAPAQVFINSISNTNIPNISAETTITNEGGGEYEYHYEWCVVSTENNPCGGSDDIYYASGAKLISPGQSFTPTLTATVNQIGDYWFKLVVYYGTEVSAASRTFTATNNINNNGNSSGSSGGGVSYNPASQTDIYQELTDIHNQLDINSQKLSATLDSLGIINPVLKNLLEVVSLSSNNLKDTQNKVADLKAISATIRQIVDGGATTPTVETYMKFNSVEIHFLITNPSDEAQTVKFKAFLPAEAKPENIMNLDGLQIDYDTNANSYYVHGDIYLKAKESIAKEVEMKDIWQFSKEEIQSIRDQVSELIGLLKKSQYETDGVLLKNSIESTLNIITNKQDESYSSPQEHIVTFRENQERMLEVKNNLEKLKSLVSEANNSKSIVGNIGGIQTFATWGIILAIVFGFALLAVVIFAMWRHQTILATQALGLSKLDTDKHFGKKVFDKYSNVDINEEAGYFHQHKSIKKIVLVIILSSMIIVFGIFASRYIYRFKDISFLKNIKVIDDKVNVNNTLIKEEDKGDTSVPTSEEKANTNLAQNDLDNISSNNTDLLEILNTETGWLNVRSEPSSKSDLINKVYPQEKYQYIDKKDNWYKIILKDKSTGWVYDKYVKITN